METIRFRLKSTFGTYGPLAGHMQTRAPKGVGLSGMVPKAAWVGVIGARMGVDLWLKSFLYCTGLDPVESSLFRLLGAFSIVMPTISDHKFDGGKWD